MKSLLMLKPLTRKQDKLCSKKSLNPSTKIELKLMSENRNALGPLLVMKKTEKTP